MTCPAIPGDEEMFQRLNKLNRRLNSMEHKCRQLHNDLAQTASRPTPQSVISAVQSIRDIIEQDFNGVSTTIGFLMKDISTFRRSMVERMQELEEDLAEAQQVDEQDSDDEDFIASETDSTATASSPEAEWQDENDEDYVDKPIKSARHRAAPASRRNVKRRK